MVINIVCATRGICVGTLFLAAPTLQFSGCKELERSTHIYRFTGGLDTKDSTQNVVETARQADSFVDSVGVVTHLSYDNTPYYQEWPKVFTLLQASGIRHIRDGYYGWQPSSVLVKEHQALALAGIRTTYVIPRDTATTAASIASFKNLVMDLEAIEAPNECDSGRNCGGGGQRGIANAAAFQEVVHGAGELLHVPVLGPSFTSREAYKEVGDLSKLMTFNNLHIYFGGREPGSQGWGDSDAEGHRYGSIDWWLDQAKYDGGHLPAIMTETGYMMPEKPTPYTIPRSLGGEYLPRTLLLAFNRHIVRTFLYELLDEISSPDYGLLTADLREKPAFTAVRSLLHLLADQGKFFSPGTLSFQLSGNNTNLQHTLLQKRDGSFWLILWREESEYDPATNMKASIPARQVTLNLKTDFFVKQISTLNDNGVIASTESKVPQASFPLLLDGHPTIVRIVSSRLLK